MENAEKSVRIDAQCSMSGGCQREPSNGRTFFSHSTVWLFRLAEGEETSYNLQPLTVMAGPKEQK
jgi:hypothetical protein